MSLSNWESPTDQRDYLPNLPTPENYDPEDPKTWEIADQGAWEKATSPPYFSVSA